MISVKSVCGWFSTAVLSWLTHTTRNDVLFWLTVAVGVSTFIYNLIKIYQSLKKNSNEKVD